MNFNSVIHYVMKFDNAVELRNGLIIFLIRHDINTGFHLLQQPL